MDIAMSNDFLGVGWDFPVGLDEQGKIKLARYEESIRQSIWIILGTARGERVMRPDFGCGIHDLVFAVHTSGTAGQIAIEVRRALLQWEPRIQVLDVQVDSGAAVGELLINIRYQIRATNTVFNLVYPFYLERNSG
jgi:phage baseplate assembly protein W